MTTSLKGNRKKLQNLIATIVEDGFYEACRTFEKAGLDESDFHNNWLEVIPVLFASAHIICDKNLSPADKANLEEAIRLVIYDSNDPEGYHNLFGHERLQPLADFISNADQFSSLVYKMHKNYLRVAGSRSDAELEQCNVILSNRMNSFKGEGAKVGSVMFAILNGMHRNIHLIGNDKPDWL